MPAVCAMRHRIWHNDLRKQARLKKRGSDLRVKQIDQVMDEIETITTDLDALLAQDDSTLDAP